MLSQNDSAPPVSGPINLGAPLADDLYLLEGKISRAWAELDYMQRIVIKRLKNLQFSNPAHHAEIESILSINAQTKIIDAITAAAAIDTRLNAGEQATLTALANSIGGARSGTHLYGRRNDVIHALWAQSLSGASFKLRCGVDYWKNPPPMPTQAQLQQLLDDINGMVASLENATATIK